MIAENEIKFGTDGWRGLIARDFTFHNVRKTAQAIADYVRPQKKASVIVGYDRRFLSDKFALAVAETLKANKIEVVLAKEPLPTPAISLLTLKKSAQITRKLRRKTLESGCSNTWKTDKSRAAACFLV